MKELPKAYEPARYENVMYQLWEQGGFFNPEKALAAWQAQNDARPVGGFFSIVLPPPNVTGTLHMGHAAMLAIEDVMVRYHRMKGDHTLWVPGTDHAAIATQSKVEKIIAAKEGKTKYDFGREAFLEKVKQFAQESHDTIINQCKKMGSSLDWSREAYTLDEVRNKVVRMVFKKMYDDGLVYRGHRIVNWDPHLQTTVSDDEVEHREERAPFYYFQYGSFVIGTSRPETKFGDKYVVMHPDDPRYAAFTHGQKIELEWVNGPITATVIKDVAVDMSFGSGVMTITPWHDATDFEIAERHNLEKQQIIDYNGEMLPIAGEFAGLPITEARKKIVEKLGKKGLLVKTDEQYVHNVAVNSRGGGIIEPQIKEQWFISVNKKFVLRKSYIDGVADGQEVSLKELMQQVVRNKQVRILPDRFEKIYFQWVDNLRDWCISRQIWFGHQVPVWYKDKEVYCGVSAPHDQNWQQDSDTLDTWFSSGLWTFSTLLHTDFEKYSTLEEWQEHSPDFKNFHPTTILETGYDILFFWVARMILMTTYTLGTIPFKTVYLHGLVRDEQGRKMSKTLDNIIDPLDMITQYGADATRLSLLIGTGPGNDLKLSEEKIAGFRNFANKLWNICRFVLLSIENPQHNISAPRPTTDADNWILGSLNQLVEDVTQDLEKYQFSAAGEKLRQFTWDELADWYLEIAKVEGEKIQILNYILNTVLKLWHPFMPFVTEAIWQEMYGGERLLLVQKWPEHMADYRHADGAVFDRVRNIVSGIRMMRAENRIAPSAKIDVLIQAGQQTELLERNAEIIKRLRTGLGNLTIVKETDTPANAMRFMEGTVEVFITMAGAVDVAKERKRLQEEAARISHYAASLQQKLGNADFIARAPTKIVDAERAKLAEAEGKLAKIQEQMASLPA